MSLRIRFRRRVFRALFIRKVAEYSLEIGLTTWGVVTSFQIFTGATSSTVLLSLPSYIRLGWGSALLLAALTVTMGIYIRPTNQTIARGMYLFGTSLWAYAAAVLFTAGWHRGGLTAGLELVVGSVCWLRGWWLTDREIALFRERERMQKEQ